MLVEMREPLPGEAAGPQAPLEAAHGACGVDGPSEWAAFLFGWFRRVEKPRRIFCDFCRPWSQAIGGLAAFREGSRLGGAAAAGETTCLNASQKPAPSNFVLGGTNENIYQVKPTGGNSTSSLANGRL